MISTWYCLHMNRLEYYGIRVLNGMPVVCMQHTRMYVISQPSLDAFTLVCNHRHPQEMSIEVVVEFSPANAAEILAQADRRFEHILVVEVVLGSHFFCPISGTLAFDAFPAVELGALISWEGVSVSVSVCIYVCVSMYVCLCVYVCMCICQAIQTVSS